MFRPLLFVVFVLFWASVARAQEAADTQDQATGSAAAPPAPYTVPEPEDAIFYETFQGDWQSRWKRSSAEKFSQGEWVADTVKAREGLEQEKGLLVKGAAKHHAISALLPKKVDVAGKDFVFQYEVRLNNGLTCGGAYIKLLLYDPKFKPEAFTNETPYVIMFGPDKCGTTDKVHFIFRHKSPTTGSYEEKHLKYPPGTKNDRNTHIYTLIIRSDNSYQVLIDQKVATKGTLLEDFNPPVNPPKEIDDPSDKQPADWVTEAKIPDPLDKKPDDWDENAPATIVDTKATKPSDWHDDEPEKIPDPEMAKPIDWNDDTDGEWEAPLIDNPKCARGNCGPWKQPVIPNPAYKGKWSPRLIDNPAYKGEWKPRKIPNPDWFEDLEPHKLSPIGALGIENWTMDEDIEFDNIYIGYNPEAAYAWAEKTWRKKHDVERANEAQKTSTSTAEGIMWYIETYPAIFVILGIVLVIVLIFVATRMCVKAPEHPEDEEESHSHTHSHAGGDHNHSHDGSDHSHSHSHGPASSATIEEVDDNSEDEKNPATEAAPVKPVEGTVKPKESDSNVTSRGPRKPKSRKDN